MAAKRKGGNGRKKTVLGLIGKENAPTRFSWRPIIVDISRKLQVPPPPLQLFGASTFELGSSSSANARIEMQQMQMAMLPPRPQGFTGGVEMEMHPMLMAMQPQPEFAAGTEIEQMLPPVPELNAVEMAHQGFGPNAGFPC